MALTVVSSTIRQVHTGQNGYKEQSGIATFTTTAANGELPVGINNIEEATFTPLGAPASDELIYLDEAAQLTGKYVIRPATKAVTVARTGASKTSGLSFFYRIRGY